MSSRPSTSSNSSQSSSEIELDRRVGEIETQLTDEERFSLILSLMVVTFGAAREKRVPADVPQCAGYVPGVPRLGIPAQRITDGPLGITTPGDRPGAWGTALACGLALGATFNPALARQSGAVIGREARAKGFNVVCTGGINLPRDPRHGRNFEYISEDPWLSGVMGAEVVIGAQAEGVVAMLKHVSLNVNEINKFWLDAIIDPAAHREADLLAFQIGIERGNPGALMGAYNKVNGAYCCGNGPILNDVIKGAWGYRGYIMSDWKAVYSWDFALHGLDQHSGAQLDEQEWFAGPLKDALAEGKFTPERLSDMVRRILRALFMTGADRWEPESATGEVDADAHHAAALEVARQGIVLLKNDDGVLPLASNVATIAAIGGHAQFGVVAGGGSSQTRPRAGYAAILPIGGEGLLAPVRREVYHPSAPVKELKKLLPDATVAYDPGIYPADAVELARRAEVAILFVTKFESEGFDDPDLTLPNGQDALVEAVAAANPNTIVVLETGNPIAMPWRDKVRAIVQAWFPGEAGGQAIAEVLTGAVNPGGRLPITFPQNVAQTPRPQLPSFGEPFGKASTIDYHEGAEVGHRWFAKTGEQPLYPFGYGLSYTTFACSDFSVNATEPLTTSFTVTNTGTRAGADVPQVYLVEAPGEARLRLLGFERVELEPGEARRVTLEVDARLLARFDGADGAWRSDAGTYVIALATAAGRTTAQAKITLPGRSFGH